MITARRAAGLACLAAAISACAGCGLPVASSPQKIPVNELPLALRQTVSPTAVISPRIHNSTPTDIYLLGPADQLVAEARYLHNPPTPQMILDALDAGPTPAELNLGIGSAIPPGADLTVGGLNGGVLTLLLDSTFGLLRPGQATYEFAQIVYSVTSLPAIKGVLFKYNGGKIEPEIGNGFIASNYVVNRSDYKQLAP